MPLNLKVTDTNHGADLGVIHKEVNTYDQLPKFAIDGFKVRVTGTDKTDFNDYYLQYETESGDLIGHGTWKEVAGFLQVTNYNKATMPHSLTRESNGSFTFKQIDWEPRGSGDDVTNPLPTFVGTYINDVTTYQNRLVFLAKDSIIASVTGEYYNFFANTVTAQADSDPIDAASSDNQVTNLEHAIIFNGSLVLFSDKAQFFHPYDTSFTTKNLNMAAKTKFTNTLSCIPATAATSIFFPFSSGESTNIRELTQESLTGNVQASIISDHCRKYIKGTCKQIVADTTNNYLFIRTDEANTIYVYQWYDKGNERKQQAIHKWVFNDPIHHIGVASGKLFMRTTHDSLSLIVFVDLSDPDTYKLHFNLKLDNKYLMTPVSETLEGAWAMYYPSYFVLDSDEERKVVSLNDADAAGTEPTNYVFSSTVLYLDKPSGSDITSQYIIGTPFKSEVTLTTPSIKDQYNRVRSRHKLRLSDLKFNLQDSGFIKFLVEYYSYGELVRNMESIRKFEQAWGANIIGTQVFALESPADIIDSLVKLPIRGDAESTIIKLESESFLPFKLVDASWSGQYNEKGRRTQ